ncbi:MAG: hypothetical protein ABIH53_03625 [archaeon]
MVFKTIKKTLGSLLLGGALALSPISAEAGQKDNAVQSATVPKLFLQG